MIFEINGIIGKVKSHSLPNSSTNVRLNLKAFENKKIFL